MYEIAEVDLDRIKRLTAKLPSNIPQSVAKIPTESAEKSILQLIKGNSVWLILTYGASLVGMVHPLAGKALKALFRLRFNWEQKDLPFEI